MKTIHLTDCTLRLPAQGQTAPGFREKIEIIKELDRLCIDAIELNILSANKADKLLLKTAAPLLQNAALCCRCENDAAYFDARLNHKLMGQIAAAFGVEPVTESVTALHAQLLREQSAVSQTPGLLEQLGEQVSELLEDNIDTKLSLGKVFWTVVCLFTIFGKKGRRKGFTLGKLFAGFGLFSMWKKK